MCVWIRRVSLLVGLLVNFSLAYAQLPEIAADDPTERDAQVLYAAGDAKVKVADYEAAISDFKTLIKRYPDTQTRFLAQFRMADALVGLKKHPDAITLLQSVVKEEDADWSPNALMKIGEIYAAQQKYTEAFRAYRQVIADYPDNPIVDHAYFEIGRLHFQAGHFEQAAAELSKVGTAFASRVPELQRVFPGEPLYVHLVEPNTVATPTTTITVTVTATSGDKETVTLLPDTEGSDHFDGSIKTTLGDAKPNDGVLQLHGSDKVTLSYMNRYVGDPTTRVAKTISMGIASNARMAIHSNANTEEISGIIISDNMVIEISDPDRDLTDAKDTISVDLKTRRKDTEKLTLTETGAHTGIFTATMPTKVGPPTPGSNIIETDAGLVEGSANKLNDAITITYNDETNLIVQTEIGPRPVSAVISLYTHSDPDTGIVKPKITDPSLAIKTALYKGRSLNEIALTYRDLGKEATAIVTFRKAADEFNDIIVNHPDVPEVEDAMYGLFECYVGQDQYESAIAMITQLTKRFPDSTKGSDALFELAALHVKHEDYDRALTIYQSLAMRAKGTPLAEEAQYAIVTTYMAMYKPKSGSLLGQFGSGVAPQQVAAAIEDFVRNYPDSERTPEILWQLVRLRFDTDDYPGAIDGARRMVALFPDNAMAGRVLMYKAMAEDKLGKYGDAIDTLRMIIANYGGELDAEKMLATELRKSGGTTPSASN